MRVAITDASVFFDLLNTGVLPEFFRLDLEVFTTDFIYNEIIKSEEKEQFDIFLRSGQLTVITIDEAEQERVAEMKLRYSNSSIADKTALFKAKELSCTLLTCDKKLRKEAEHHNIEVFGSVWIIDELVGKGKLNISRGIEVFERLKQVNAWLPMEEINKRIAHLKTLLSI